MKASISLLFLLPYLVSGEISEPRSERGANIGNIHVSPHSVHHPLPTQPSGYPYHPSQPSYPDIIGPAYRPPPPLHAEPIYGHHPSHNCTVEDEVLQAEICTPTYAPSCGPFKVKGTKLGEKEKCVNVSRTVCTQSEETQSVEVCLVEYEDKKQEVTATTVEVKFAKACEKQMVTVCQPQPQPSYGSPPSPYSYHTVQHCKEVGQETCYNIPRLESKEIQVEITLPEPVQKCQTRSVIVPTVECEDFTDKKCVKLPNVEETEEEAKACVPVVAKPKCDKVELVLPKQVCRELLYGYAEKPVHQYEHPKPVHQYEHPKPVHQYEHPKPVHQYEQDKPLLKYGHANPTHHFEHSKQQLLSHSGKIKYGPKVTKRFSSTEELSKPEESDSLQIAETIAEESLK